MTGVQTCALPICSVVGTTEIFTERRPTGGADTRLASCDDEGAWCETLDDLYGNRSRRTIGQLLRGFLDANGVTPTEVLHSFRVYKRLDNADSLLSAAVSRIARARATATKTDGALTQRAIDQIVQQAAVRVRDAAAMRSVPTIGDGGLDALLATLWWPGSAIFLATTLVTYFGWRLDLD